MIRIRKFDVNVFLKNKFKLQLSVVSHFVSFFVIGTMYYIFNIHYEFSFNLVFILVHITTLKYAKFLHTNISIFN